MVGSEELLQYLSQRNFVNEVGTELDDVDDEIQDESLPGGPDTPWNADFDDDFADELERELENSGPATTDLAQDARELERWRQAG